MLGTASDEGTKDAPDDSRSHERPRRRGGRLLSARRSARMGLDLNDQFPALEFDPQLAESVSPVLHVTPDDAADAARSTATRTIS